jgi:hypothetical protein
MFSEVGVFGGMTLFNHCVNTKSKRRKSKFTYDGLGRDGACSRVDFALSTNGLTLELAEMLWFGGERPLNS